MSNKAFKNKALGAFTLAMLSASAIISLRNLPATALEGERCIFFFALSAIAFFIPVALTCAELASAWPQSGGAYTWIKEAFGPRIGLLGIWLEWIESVIWLPTVLSFMAATTAYLIDPALCQNAWFITFCMLFYLVMATVINFYGIELSSLISTLGVLLGSIIPAILLVFLSLWYLRTHPESNQLSFTYQRIIPPLDGATLSTFTLVLLGFCGMEIPAYHVQNVANPRTTYPRAMFLACTLILSVSILGSLAIAAVVPHQSINLIAGPMQAFEHFFQLLNLSFATPAIAAFTLVGGIAILNTWIIGPSKGLNACLSEYQLPKFCVYQNKKNVPVSLLIFQAVLSGALSLLFSLNESIQAAYWMVNTLAAQLYLGMYLILFLAVIKLRHSHPQVRRSYQIPGGLVGVYLVGGLGAAACVLAIAVGFIKPANIDINLSRQSYAALLLGAMFVFSGLPLIFLRHKKREVA